MEEEEVTLRMLRIFVLGYLQNIQVDGTYSIYLKKITSSFSTRRTHQAGCAFGMTLHQESKTVFWMLVISVKLCVIITQKSKCKELPVKN